MSDVLKILASSTFLEPYTSGHDESGNMLNLYTEQDLIRACEIVRQSAIDTLRKENEELRAMLSEIVEAWGSRSAMIEAIEKAREMLK
jgi:hypothetical protein